MPSTITTYYTFQPATKARSSQVNTNFSNYRGDLLPINEATATASDNTHNLGSSDHRWNTAYLTQIEYSSATTTATVVTKADTSSTLGSWAVQIEGVDTFRVSPNTATFAASEIGFSGATTTVRPILKANTGATLGAVDLLFGSSTITTWDSGGLQHRSIDVGLFTSSSAPLGSRLITANTSTASISTQSTTGQTLAVCRINTRGGGIVRVGVFNSYISSVSIDPNGGIFTVAIYRGATTTGLSQISASPVRIGNMRVSAGNDYAESNLNLVYYDTSYTSGEIVYQFILRSVYAATATSALDFSASAAFFIEEI